MAANKLEDLEVEYGEYEEKRFPQYTIFCTIRDKETKWKAGYLWDIKVSIWELGIH